jgi:hypothetical protein
LWLNLSPFLHRSDQKPDEKRNNNRFQTDIQRIQCSGMEVARLYAKDLNTRFIFHPTEESLGREMEKHPDYTGRILAKRKGALPPKAYHIMTLIPCLKPFTNYEFSLLSASLGMHVITLIQALILYAATPE